MKIEAILAGAYDIHVHCTPDVVPRSQDLLDLARAGNAAGMAGILVKEHTTSTVGRAYALNHMGTGGVRFFSSLALNPPVGNLNPSAVESALRAGVDVIYFPTYGAANHIHIWGAGKPPTAFPLPRRNYQGVSILDSEGKMKPECEPILNLIARHDGVLATGHLSPEESLVLLEAARSGGVTRMVVTHASEPVSPMSLDQQRQAVSLGAFIEHCFFAVTESCPNAIALGTIADQIREVGVEHCILSSDFGQVANGPVVEGFSHYLEKMRGLGFTAEALREMIVTHPRQLLEGRSE
jgi:hypothetical protein